MPKAIPPVANLGILGIAILISGIFPVILPTVELNPLISKLKGDKKAAIIVLIPLMTILTKPINMFPKPLNESPSHLATLSQLFHNNIMTPMRTPIASAIRTAGFAAMTALKIAITELAPPIMVFSKPKIVMTVDTTLKAMKPANIPANNGRIQLMLSATHPIAFPMPFSIVLIVA